MKHARKITLTDDEQRKLNRWTRGRRTPARLVLRAKIILLAADGMMNKDIAESLKTARKTVSLWRTRFAEQRLAGIEKDSPRGGRPPEARTRLARAIITKTTQEKPADATHWSTRSLAKTLGTSSAMVQRVWKANGLQPHRTKTFNSCPERLTMVERQLMVDILVGNRRPERRRQWPWEQIEAFRVEPTVGSHFL